MSDGAAAFALYDVRDTVVRRTAGWMGGANLRMPARHARAHGRNEKMMAPKASFKTHHARTSRRHRSLV